MFTNHSYTAVNREERHFGFLFGSAIIHNQEFAERIFDRYNSVLGSYLEVKTFDIFFEVAALRDFWRDLGRSDEYTDGTHARRRDVLNAILQHKGYDPGMIDHNKVFWTSGNIGSGKLWCPSEWNIKEIQKIEKSINDLVSIRWCFNAKPDILIVSNTSCVFIEIKVESGSGKSNSGYDQLDVQEEISDFMKLLIPEFHNHNFYNSSLTLNDELRMKGLKWSEIIDMLESAMDGKLGSIYVHKCLSELQRYYK